jgi:putative transposase
LARPLRIEFPGALYHITSRGNDRQETFKDDRDRQYFLDLLAVCCNRFQWLCHAYCLMSNHYHLVLEIQDNALSRGMRHLNGVYTQKFNWNHHQVGHLFQGRYKAVLIQRDTHLLQACRYVVLNPIRAKLVKAPEAWKWSSYRGTCGITQPAPCLTTDWVLAQFAEVTDKAQKQYREFVKDGIDGGSIWKDLKYQVLLGDDDFVNRYAEVAGGIEKLTEVPKAQRPSARPSLEQLFPPSIMMHRLKRDQRVVEAVVLHSYSQKAVADHLQLHYSSISRILGTGKGKDVS